MDLDNLRKEINNIISEQKDVLERITALENQGFEESELKWHIDKLHEYNEIKDVTQMILGRLAELNGTTTKEVYKEYDLDLED